MATFNLISCEESKYPSIIGVNIELTIGDINDYIDKWLFFEEDYEHVYYLTVNEQIDNGDLLSYDSVRESVCCYSCNEVTYLLTDCTNRIHSFHSRQSDLEAIVGKIIKIPSKDNACFFVSKTACLESDVRYDVEYSHVYDSCNDCYQRQTIEPLPLTLGCDCNEDLLCERYNTVFPKYKDEIFKRKYGITSCCDDVSVNDEIKLRRAEFESIRHCSPDLPEPIVDICCINIKNSDSQCCEPCSKNVIDIDENKKCICVCEASENSPHDCHVYNFNVTNDYLSNAVGNDNDAYNGKVVFSYFPCKKTNVKTEVFESEENNIDRCVLGIPIFGYYNNNNFVVIDILRSDICEAIDANCNDCNTCN